METHDIILGEESSKHPGFDTIVLAQASMASAQKKVEEATGSTVLTSPSSCIEEVKAFYGKK